MPSQGTPLLGAASDEAVDARTLSFLLVQAARVRKKEEGSTSEEGGQVGIGDGEGCGEATGGGEGAAAAVS